LFEFAVRSGPLLSLHKIYSALVSALERGVVSAAVSKDVVTAASPMTTIAPAPSTSTTAATMAIAEDGLTNTVPPVHVVDPTQEVVVSPVAVEEKQVLPSYTTATTTADETSSAEPAIESTTESAVESIAESEAGEGNVLSSDGTESAAIIQSVTEAESKLPENEIVREEASNSS